MEPREVIINVIKACGFLEWDIAIPFSDPTYEEEEGPLEDRPVRGLVIGEPEYVEAVMEALKLVKLNSN